MTSEELHALCKDHIGKPWWRIGVRYDWNLHGPKRVKRWYCDVDVSISETTAHDLIIGSAVRWLHAMRPHFCIDRYLHNADDAHWSRVNEGGFDEAAPSLLAAVLAACAAVDGGQ